MKRSVIFDRSGLRHWRRALCGAFIILIVRVAQNTDAQVFIASFDPQANGVVGEYSVSGQPINPSLLTGFVDPQGLAFSGDNLFVSDLAGTIGEYTISGAVVNASLITGLSNPRSMVVSNGLLYVATTDSGSGTIGVYTTSGQAVNASLITGLSDLKGLAISGDKIFVLNGLAGSVAEYTTSGTLVNPSLITGLGAHDSDIAAGDQSLFIGKQTSGEQVLGKFSMSGVMDPSFSIHNLTAPNQFTISGTNLYITNYNGTVGEYTTSGQTVNASLITLSGGYHFPFSIAVVPEPSAVALFIIGLLLVIAARPLVGASKQST